MKEIKRNYFVFGDVQGIGFRDNVRKKAKEMNLSCSAENIIPAFGDFDRKVFVGLSGNWIGIVRMVSWIRSLNGVKGVVFVPPNKK